MIVTGKLSKMNVEVFKKILDPRPLYSVLKSRQYSQNADDIFKFYDDQPSHMLELKEKYRTLDEKDYNRFISKRAMKREPALTRQITTLSYNVSKEMMSLAEGMPNEAIFPFTRLEMSTRSGESLVLEEKELATALQYLPSQGLPSLLKELRQFQQDLHRPPPLSRDVIVTNGAQHGIYQCVEMLMDPGDPIITTEFTYTGIHSALKPYQPEIIGIPEDENGLIAETLDSVLKERLARGLKMPRLLYFIPTGNNPTGTVISVERRRQIYELACKYDFLLVEDDPYMFLNYNKASIPSFLSLDVCGRVIRLDSVSKVISSGLRAGWLTAPTALMHRAELHAQAELLHSCTLAQTILLQLFSNRSALASHLLSTRSFYELRRNALSAALRGIEGLADWSEPNAGLFHWVRVRGVEDVYNMVFHVAFQRGLILIPGQAFLYDSGATCQYIRLAFSKINVNNMETAIRYLADIIREEQKLVKQPKRLATER
ncbi:kynurenine/alpha-aminoadipate aminotransferase, mitochondrial [Vanessa tameamea]|uniref:Kynurenine/alpha-aminoadipate aminotransferase, mitochondrial n=1 Tax=Vanessa tameamea TaxID=334116 RepID=A0A8B8ISF9_VANTA|nr:kynurenine/alpha-aminoadipate aminotransferase, mitochondrial [Vanessa tameamea]